MARDTHEGDSSSHPETQPATPEQEREVKLPVDRPDGAKTTAELEAERDAEKQLSPAERIEKLEKDLLNKRNVLAHVSAKRGTRMFSRKNSLKTQVYESLHGDYNKTLRELGRLKLEQGDGEHFENIEDGKEGPAVVKWLLEEQNKLREQTTQFMEGTPVGKVVKWLNKEGDSRLKRFMKHAGVGIVVGGAGAAITLATGGVAAAVGAGGVIGLGVGAAGRGFRGFLSGEGKNGRRLNEADESHLAEQLEDANGDAGALLDSGTAALKEGFNSEIKGRQKQFRRSIGRGAVYAAVGSSIGFGIHHAGSIYDTVRGGGSGSNANLGVRGPVSADGAEHQASPEGTGPISPDAAEHAALLNRFEYNAQENPFYRAKVGIHDMGGALRPDAALDAGRPAGFNDLVNNRWVDSPEQLASIYSAMNINHAADNMDAINGLAEHFKVNPYAMQDAHSEVLSIINDPNTTFRTEEITHPYSSEYGVDQGRGDVKLGWDDYVDEGGTKTVIEYTDPNTGVRRVLELRNDCGGQRIVEHPDVPVPEYVPQEWSEQYAPAYSAASTGNGGESWAPDTTSSTPGTGNGGNTPGGNTPGGSTPGGETPGQQLAPKDIEDNWMRNSGVPDWAKNLGDMFGSGALQGATDPPDTYTGPSASPDSSPSTNIPSGASGNTDTDPHGGGGNGNLPAAEAGLSGAGGGDSTPRSNGTVSE